MITSSQAAEELIAQIQAAPGNLPALFQNAQLVCGEILGKFHLLQSVMETYEAERRKLVIEVVERQRGQVWCAGHWGIGPGPAGYVYLELPENLALDDEQLLGQHSEIGRRMVYRLCAPCFFQYVQTGVPLFSNYNHDIPRQLRRRYRVVPVYHYPDYSETFFDSPAGQGGATLDLTDVKIVSYPPCVTTNVARTLDLVPSLSFQVAGNFAGKQPTVDLVAGSGSHSIPFTAALDQSAPPFEEL